MHYYFACIEMHLNGFKRAYYCTVKASDPEAAKEKVLKQVIKDFPDYWHDVIIYDAIGYDD